MGVEKQKVKVIVEVGVEKGEMDVEEEGHLCLLVVLGDALDDWLSNMYTVHPDSHCNFILV